MCIPVILLWFLSLAQSKDIHLVLYQSSVDLTIWDVDMVQQLNALAHWLCRQEELHRTIEKKICMIVKFIIISMTKLLDADWLRGVQLFH